MPPSKNLITQPTQLPLQKLTARSVGDRTQLFDKRRAFLAIVDHEGVVFSKSGPWPARHSAKLYEPPIGHIRWL